MTRFGANGSYYTEVGDQTLVLRRESVPIVERFGARNVTSVLPGVSPTEFTDVAQI